MFSPRLAKRGADAGGGNSIAVFRECGITLIYDLKRDLIWVIANKLEVVGVSFFY